MVHPFYFLSKLGYIFLTPDKVQPDERVCQIIMLEDVYGQTKVKQLRKTYSRSVLNLA